MYEVNYVWTSYSLDCCWARPVSDS